ncbi:hypothetical protein FQN49_000829 [Arthroderma sp. PD_2]|nr:hypothetical protein FQN49_000829 [Arthroderma sp. PD_2]
MLADEEMCRQVCRITGTTHCWIRAAVHSTATVAIAQGKKCYIPADPHITVFLGDGSVRKYHGHIYVIMSRSAPYTCSRLATAAERRLPEDGRKVNPELWDMNNKAVSF